MKLPRPKIPKWTRQVGWRTVAGAVLLAGIVHIGATMAVPHIALTSSLIGPNAFRKIRDALPVNQMVYLPPPTPGNQLLPFMTADALYAVCRYDIAAAPLTVTALLPDPGWTLSMHTPEGDNFYVMPAQQLRRNEVTFVVVPGGDRLLDIGAAARRAAGPDAPIEAPATEGLVLVRAPLRGLAWRADTEAKLRRAGCASVQRKR